MSNRQDWQSALGSLLSSGELPDAEPMAQAQDPAPSHSPSGRIVITYERKGRGGKEVTIASGFELDHEELSQLASWLKQKLGAGGSARGGEILIQGDRRDRLAELLRQKGYRI